MIGQKSQPCQHKWLQQILRMQWRRSTSVIPMLIWSKQAFCPKFHEKIPQTPPITSLGESNRFQSEIFILRLMVIHAKTPMKFPDQIPKWCQTKTACNWLLCQVAKEDWTEKHLRYSRTWNKNKQTYYNNIHTNSTQPTQQYCTTKNHYSSWAKSYKAMLSTIQKARKSIKTMMRLSSWWSTWIMRMLKPFRNPPQSPVRQIRLRLKVKRIRGWAYPREGIHSIWMLHQALWACRWLIRFVKG